MTSNNPAALTFTPAPRAGGYPWNDKPLLPIDRGIPTHEEMHRASRHTVYPHCPLGDVRR